MSICSTGLPAAPTRRWGALNLNSKPELPPPGAYPARVMPVSPRHCSTWRVGAGSWRAMGSSSMRARSPKNDWHVRRPREGTRLVAAATAPPPIIAHLSRRGGLQTRASLGQCSTNGSRSHV
jgi:hypothetical protein